jgi:hypothetical protein
MAVKLDNMDSVLKQLAKMEKAVATEVIREARKRLRATVRKYVPVYKNLTKVNTIERTGDLVKSIKVKGRSRRGVSNVKLIFTVPYAGYLNFTKGYKTESFATDQYKKDVSALDQQGLQDVKDAFKTVFKRHGVKYR